MIAVTRKAPRATQLEGVGDVESPDRGQKEKIEAERRQQRGDDPRSHSLPDGDAENGDEVCESRRDCVRLYADSARSDGGNQ